MICQPINTTQIEESVDDAELLKEFARETAKGCFQLYMSDGLTQRDYEFTHTVFQECLLYFQRKRDEK